MGNLIIPRGLTPKLYWELIEIKKRHDVSGELHFSRMPNKYNRSYSAKAHVAKDWLRLFLEREGVFFTFFGLNEGALSFDPSIFPNKFDRYNAAARVCLSSSIGFHVTKNPSELSKFYGDPCFSVYSDEMTRCIRDNFEEVCIRKTRKQQNMSGSRVEFDPKRVIQVPSGMEPFGTFIQLTDLLIGSTRTAIMGGDSNLVKKDLADLLGNKFLRIKGSYVRTSFSPNRKFNIVNFPDENRKATNTFRIRKMEGNQKILSDF